MAATSLMADDRNEPWWNSQWLLQEHVIVTPVVSGWNGRMAAAQGHVTNYPQLYSDYMPSQSTVTNANILAQPGGYAAAVRSQR
jgi:hypothetical protein